MYLPCSRSGRLDSQLCCELLPTDNLRIIFKFLPIPDKRNLIRTNKKCNMLSNLIPDAENYFWNHTIVDYVIGCDSYSCVKKCTLLEKKTMEYIYYGYINIMPMSYINNNNKLFIQKYIYFHTGVIGNEDIIYMLLCIANGSKLLENILSGIAFSGNFVLLKRYYPDFPTPALNVTVSRAARVNGHMQILKWLFYRSWPRSL